MGERAPRRKKALPVIPKEAAVTRRQELLDLLEASSQSFHGLRRTFGMPAAELEVALRHIERSLRAAGRRLSVQPAECLACGLVFEDRPKKHLHPPSRCPRCKGSRIDDTVFEVRG